MGSAIIKSGLTWGLFIAMLGLINQGIGRAIDSPNGGFQDRLDSFLLVLLLPAVVMLVIGFVIFIWTEK